MLDKIKYCKLNNFGVKECSAYYKVSTKTIYNWEKKNLIVLKRERQFNHSRKYTVDDIYFEKIDTENKAYWLGFIYADGHIHKQRLELALSNKDIKHIKLFQEHIGNNSPIECLKRDRARLTICSCKLVDSLRSRYNLSTNKTFNIQMPQIDKSLIRHFVRGYFDGDGYIGEKQAALVCASDVFTSQLLELIKELFPELNIWHRKYDKTNRLNFGKKDKEFINWIYKDAGIFLDRKYTSFLTNWIVQK